MIICAKECISDFFRKVWNIDPERRFEVERVNAKQFLTPQRIDLVCKLEYIDAVIKQRNLSFARELYTEHIRAFSNGTFTEPGTEEKNSIEKYFNEFDFLIKTLPENGIKAEISVVGVGEDGNILDGSHRTAIAIYFGLELPIVRIPKRTVNYNYMFFRDRGLSDEYLDYMVLKYINLSANNIYLATLWPVADDVEKKKIAESLMEQTASIVYKKGIRLNYHGLIHFMIHTYGLGRTVDQWAGNEENGFCGIYGKANCCYEKGKITTIYVLEGDSIDDMIRLKKQIRDIYRLNNHSIHITDTKEEAVFLGQASLNKNSIEFLNYGDPFAFPSFTDRRSQLYKRIKETEFGLENIIFVSDYVLAMYGLKNTGSIRCLSGDCRVFSLLKEFCDVIDISQCESGQHILYNPKEYFYYRGVKVEKADGLYIKKSIRIFWRIKLKCNIFFRIIINTPIRWQKELLKEKLKCSNNRIVLLLRRIRSNIIRTLQKQ